MKSLMISPQLICGFTSHNAYVYITVILRTQNLLTRSQSYTRSMLSKILDSDLLRGVCVALWILELQWPIDTYLNVRDEQQSERH